MTESDAGRGGVEPGVYLLPLALPEPFRCAGVDSEVLARRLPDLVHLLLNAGRQGPAGMLEVQSPPDDGPPRWVTLSDVPSPDEVIPMLGAEAAGALVAGALRQGEDGLTLEIAVHAVGGIVPTDEPVHRVHAVVELDDPAGSVVRLAEHLATLLGLRFQRPEGGFLSRNPTAFFRYLEALDGAALLAGDPDLESERLGEDLLRPLAEALRLDPGFGLALRTLAQILFPALHGERIAEAACYRVLDTCFACEPTDGEGCVEVAEQLLLLGDTRRGRRWLERAVALPSPPSRALEALGVQYGNDGDGARAAKLWRRGLAIDGHPDFWAHLARLAFREGRDADGWDAMLRGLVGKTERQRRAAEWDEDGRGTSVLLRYLAEHLEDETCPAPVASALAELAGWLDDGSERVDLALCLRAIGRDDLAAAELEAASAIELPPTVEDRATRARLAIDIPQFERRFRRAAERATAGRDPQKALVEMQAFLERQPGFWPALYYAGVAMRRLGRVDDALDLMAEVAMRRPGQSDALVAMAELFDGRGNPKRGLECVDEALVIEPDNVDMILLRAQCLEHLGRSAEAEQELERAIALAPSPRKLRRRTKRRRA